MNTLCDSLLGDRFTELVSVRLMRTPLNSISPPSKIRFFMTNWSAPAARPPAA